jgi:alcohol dehydrogenase (NADP+)
MIKTLAYAARDPKSPLTPYTFDRRTLRPKDVHIEILYCGVCHSDIHTARNEWGGTQYPIVPGHEIVGTVKQVGSGARKYKVGDIVGVGCLVDSCRDCYNCKDGLEQFCLSGMIGTYNAIDPHTKEITQGGYSSAIVVDEDFVFKVPTNLELSHVAPLLCAGITTYSPLRHWKVKKGDRVGVVGLGGLGHMAVKLAHSLGAHVAVFTTSPNKKEDALRLGADEVVLSKDPDSMAKQAGRFSFILDTVSAPHDLDTYLSLLKRDGHLCLVGASPEAFPVHSFSVIFGRKSFAGSLIGGIAETQEMLDYCGEHNITSDVEIVPIQKINEAFDRTVKSDVKYRFVIDMKSLQ